MHKPVLVLVLALTFASRWASADAIPFPHAQAVRFAAAPSIDGHTDDAVWASAPLNDRFYQVQPAVGPTPTEKTQFRIGYDDDHLYVAVDCLDSDPSGVAARLTRRDRDIEADWLAVTIDSRNDRNSARTFQISPANVQVDGQVFADTEFSYDWDAVWEAVAIIDATGWHAEFAIPLTVLRFSSADVQTWGLQVHRNLSRKREQMMWSYDGKQGETWGVTRFGYLDGLRGLHASRAFELRPYVATGVVTRNDRGGGFLGSADGTHRDFKLDAGADLKLGLSSQLTLDLSVNPDFGQVEADQVVLNLTRFETFFPEKRTFFLEGIDIFSTPIQLFYPRRIGRPAVGFDVGAQLTDGMSDLTVTAADGTVRLWTAAKLTGEVGDGVSFGALVALVGKETVDVENAAGEERSFELAPLRAYGVLRARYALGGGSFVGFTGTGMTRVDGEVFRAAADHDAYVEALDFFWRSEDRLWTVRGQAAVSELVGGPGYRRGDGRACTEAESATDAGCLPIARPDGTRLGPGAVGVGVQARSLYQTADRLLKIEYIGHTAKFDANDVGYAPQFNLNELKIVGGWADKVPDDYTLYRAVYPFAVAAVSMDGTPQYVMTGVDLEANFKNNLQMSPEQWIKMPGSYDIYETFDGARFQSPPAWEGHVDAHTNQADALSLNAFFSWSLGLFDETRSTSAELGLNWQVRSNVELALAPGAGIDHAVRFYDCSTPSGRSCLVENGPRHYLFADLDSRYFTLTLRGTVTLAPPLSIQAYAQYFVASGEFSDYRQVDTDGAQPVIRRRDLVPSTFNGDFDGDGQADDGFETASLNVNLVLRWEAMPGSVLYAVYTRSQESPFARLNRLDEGPTTDVVLVKFVYFIK